MADEVDSTVVDEEVDETEEVDQETEDESEVEETEEETTEDEETTTEEDEESDDSEEPEPQFDKRFTQFKGDSLPEYTKNLEEAYANSSGEAVKLNKLLTEYKQKLDQITGAVANDPELAEKLNVPKVSTDPALDYARQQMEEKMQSEYDAFAKNHPEIESDPELSERLTKRLTILSRSVSSEEGRQLGMMEGLEMAWASLGLGNNSQEATRMAAKSVAAVTKTASAKKSVPKSTFTPAQLAMAERMGLTEKDLRAAVTK